MPVYIKKYTGSNYFQNRNHVDKIVIEYLPTDSFPIFGFETENFSEVGTYRGGDFDINLTLLDSTTSTLGKTIKEFLFGEERDYFYLVIVKIGNQTFSGIAQQSQISADFTYSQNRDNAKLVCKDILIEFSKRCSVVANSTIVLADAEQLTFEEYIARHFSGVTGDVVQLQLPAQTYLSRLQELYSNIQWCYALGDYRNFITGQQSISRWETFKELAKGMGFNFEMYLLDGTEALSSPEFVFNIFFIDDLSSQTPIDVEVLEHKEFTTASRLEYLFLKYRSLVLGSFDYSSGIFFNSVDKYGSDTDNAGNLLHPACQLRLDNRVLDLTNSGGTAVQTVLRDVDFLELELKQYAYSFTSRPIGKLYPPGTGVTVGMAYSRIFNCSRVHGAIDFYDFIPVQENAILNYKRYLKGLQEAKELKVVFNSSTELKTWRVIRLYINGAYRYYYISALRNIDTQNGTAEIEAIRLITS